MNNKKILNFIFSVFLSFFLFAEESSFIESVDSQNRLRLMTYEDEFFIPEKKENDSVLINKAGKTVNRSFYDELNRLTKKEIWEIPDARNSKMTVSECYEYEGNSDQIFKKTVTTDLSEEITDYNNKGLPVLTELYYFKDGEPVQEGEPEKIRYLFSTRKISYDEKDRVLSDSLSDEKNTRLKKYNYHEDENVPADFESFENGKLVKRIVYDASSTYFEEVFFDSSYSVKTFFEEGNRVKDEYYMNGKILRTKEYE